MQRFFLLPEQTRDDLLTLTEREAHHALNVLRVQPGDAVTVLNGQGEKISCQVAELRRKEVRLRVVHREQASPRPWPITLIQALPKGKTFDTIVQKATELGAGRIIPLLSQRVVSHVDDDRSASKLEHWRAIAIESVKQCGSPWVPALDAPATLPQLLSRLPASPLRLVASLRPNARHPRAIIQPVLSQSENAKAGIQVFVGPEGDFTDDELQCLENAGAQPVSLGSLVLRADTAAIYALSMLNYEIDALQ